MNERIRQLAHEAGLPTYNPEGIPTKLEKFAELIVRECIDIIGPYAVRMDDFDGGHPIADLKKHFGVE